MYRKSIEHVIAALEDNDDDSDVDSYVYLAVDVMYDSDIGIVEMEADFRDDISRSNEEEDEKDPMREEDCQDPHRIGSVEVSQAWFKL